MKEDEKLAADEAQRIAQHESVKGEVREKVHADITRQADRHMPAEQRNRLFAAAGRRYAVSGVVQQQLEHTPYARVVVDDENMGQLGHRGGLHHVLFSVAGLCIVACG